MSKAESKPYGTVLIKADQILNFLFESAQPQRLNVIAKATDLTNSTASKILNTLVLIGYVRRDSKTNEFELGPSIIKYAKQSLKQLDIKKIAQPHLEELQRITTETVHLGMIENAKIVYITKIESNNPVTLYSQIGRSIPLYCSAMGKSILAEQTAEEIEEYLNEHELIPKTENTITTKKAFRNELNTIKARGYAFDDGEHEVDVFCVAASLTVHGNNFGAFSVSVPKYRINEDFTNEIIEAVQNCKTAIEDELQ
ncbi:IclR family transcriptional regulator [Sporosarcina jiandibaonis]|uniref:IclR family transcriptional regulator n=1 Tax=Sporosarcina jiandibaonis TaxID=2715535 RepID=UPI0015541380|nr:IclR family transcriptional regulator [Sporosarcina jiandibaonis]